MSAQKFRLASPPKATAFVVCFLISLLTSCSKPAEQQKLPAESSPKAESVGREPVTPPTPKKGDLRIKVGVVMKSGDVKPIARTDFVLGKLSLAKLDDEEFAASPPPTAEAFCKTQGFSPELLGLLATFKWDLDAFFSSLLYAGNDTERLMKSSARLTPEMREVLEKSVADSKKGLTVDQVLPVPELKKPYDDGYAGAVTLSMWTAEQNEAEKRNTGLHHVYLYADNKVKNISSNYAQAIGNARRQALVRAQARIMAANPVIAKTSLTGEAVFREVPVGEYYVSNVDYSQISESSILWDLPVKVSDQGENYVELSNDNAWR